MSAFKRYANKLRELGYSPLPIVPGEKRPLGETAFYGHWNELRCHALLPQQIDILSRMPHLGLGVAGGFSDLVPVDYDANDPAIKRAAFSVLPKIKVAKVGRKGCTAFYRGKVGAVKFRAPLASGGWEMLLEVLSTGQTVIPPTVHPDGMSYRWITPATLFNTRIDDLPEITQLHIDNLRDALNPWLPKSENHTLKRVYSPSVVADDHMRRYALVALHNEARRLSELAQGRNWQLFTAACKIGRFINHGVLTESEVMSALMGASERNGYIAAKHGGAKQAWKTLRSGLNKSLSDPLPDLAA